jgi:type IV pilus assembly protein PilF
MGPLIARCLAAATLAALLAGCVTGSSRPPPAAASKKEAAQYNMQLGISYLRQGDYKAAQGKLEKAVAEDGSLVPAWLGLGLVLERLGDPEGAEKNYRRALGLDGSNPDALNALAVFLCLQKSEPEEAMRYFDKAIAVPLAKADANKAMLYANAGTCAKRLDLERAEAYLRQSIATDPGYRDALLQLADVSFARGNPLPARAFLERYLAAGSATADALWLGVRIEKALGEARAAADYGARLKQEFPASVEYRQLLESERRGG